MKNLIVLFFIVFFSATEFGLQPGQRMLGGLSELISPDPGQLRYKPSPTFLIISTSGEKYKAIKTAKRVAKAAKTPSKPTKRESIQTKRESVVAKTRKTSVVADTEKTTTIALPEDELSEEEQLEELYKQFQEEDALEDDGDDGGASFDSSTSFGGFSL